MRSIDLLRSEKIARQAVESHGAMQKPRELAALLDVFDHPPKVVLEIGGMHGGTAWAWKQIGAERVVTVDMFALEGRMDWAPIDVILVEGDSHDRETRVMAGDRLGGLADFLFIDGDHSYAGVKQDFDMYSSLVKPSGVIALHDVSVEQLARYRPIHDVIPFWNQVRQYHKHLEIYDAEGDQWGGIGVLWGPWRSGGWPEPEPEDRLGTVMSYDLCGTCAGELVSGESHYCANCAAARS